MRLAGAHVDEIAASLGVTSGRVSQLIGEAMADLSEAITADAEQMREMQRRDIMSALAALRQSITSKDAGERMAASDRIARLWARLSDLYGLDAPKKTDVTSDGKAIKGYVVVSPDDWDNRGNSSDV
jgi:hypothetical protein